MDRGRLQLFVFKPVKRTFEETGGMFDERLDEEVWSLISLPLMLNEDAKRDQKGANNTPSAQRPKEDLI